MTEVELSRILAGKGMVDVFAEVAKFSPGIVAEIMMMDVPHVVKYLKVRDELEKLRYAGAYLFEEEGMNKWVNNLVSRKRREECVAENEKMMKANMYSEMYNDMMASWYASGKTAEEAQTYWNDFWSHIHEVEPYDMVDDDLTPDIDLFKLIEEDKAINAGCGKLAEMFDNMNCGE